MRVILRLVLLAFFATFVLAFSAWIVSHVHPMSWDRSTVRGQVTHHQGLKLEDGYLRVEWKDTTFRPTSTFLSTEGGYSNWPLADIFTVTMVIPLLWLLDRLCGGPIHRRQRQGKRCGVCGYDLRATPERCPECGTIAAKAVA